LLSKDELPDTHKLSWMNDIQLATASSPHRSYIRDTFLCKRCMIQCFFFVCRSECHSETEIRTVWCWLTQPPTYSIFCNTQPTRCGVWQANLHSCTSENSQHDQNSMSICQSSFWTWFLVSNTDRPCNSFSGTLSLACTTRLWFSFRDHRNAFSITQLQCL